MATRLQWDQIKPDFSNSAASMRNAMTGISEAGTVFDRIRDDIAAEEQAALEAAYKQQVFDENVRQFNLTQAWNEENAANERLFRLQLAKEEDDRARKRTQLQHDLDTKAKNKNIKAYNTLNTVFMDALKQTGDPVKADETVRKVHSTDFSDVLFDPHKIYGNYVDVVTQGYSPDNRFLRDIDTVREGATAGQTLVGANKTLKDKYSNYAISNGTVWQEDANGNIFPVPDTPKRKQYLDLINDKPRLAQIEQIAKDRLTALGLSPLQVNRVLSDIGSQSAIDQERAILTLASANNVAKPENIAVANSYFKKADAARANEEAKEKAEIERKKLFTPEAYNKAYMEVYDEAVKNEDTKDIFNVGKNPKLNASIELLSNAMRTQEAPASEFKKILKKLKTQGSGWFSNDDITSKDLNNPVLIEARNKFLPNLVESTEKPEPNKTGNSGVGNTNEGSTGGTVGTNASNVVTPPTTISTTNTSEDLKNADIKLTPRIVKQLKTQRNILQQALKAQDTKDTQQITKRIAYLDSAITNLQNKKAITVSDADAYTYIKELLDRTGIREVKANDAGEPIFTENIDLASRLLRLLETPSK